MLANAAPYAFKVLLSNPPFTPTQTTDDEDAEEEEEEEEETGTSTARETLKHHPGLIPATVRTLEWVPSQLEPLPYTQELPPLPDWAANGEMDGY